MKKSKLQEQSDSQYVEQSIQKQFLPRKSNNKGKSWEKWTIQQNIKYLIFLQNNQTLFLDQFTRRSRRVFLNLSKIMPKRTADQCRTHHQKMHTKYKGNMDDIINQLKTKIIANLRKKAARKDEWAKERLQHFETTKKFDRKNTTYRNTVDFQQQINKVIAIQQGKSIQIRLNLDFAQTW